MTTIRSLLRRSAAILVAAGGIGAAAGVLAAPATANAYNVGVKHLNFTWTMDSCTDDFALPCTPGAGEGDANVIQVRQAPLLDPLEFDGFETNSALGDSHVWLAATVGTECKTSHRIAELRVDEQAHATPEDGFYNANVNTNGAGPGGHWNFPRLFGVVGDKTLPDTRIALNVPLEVAFVADLISGFPTEESIYAYGEQVVQDRIASGWTEEEARTEGFGMMTTIGVSARVICKYNGGIQAHYAKRQHAAIPLEIQFLPAPVVAGVHEEEPFQRPDTADDLVNPWVEQADLVVTPDAADPCTLHLSGTVVTNAPFTVKYRIIDPYGKSTGQRDLVIDQTLVGMFGETVDVPHGPPNSDDDAVGGEIGLTGPDHDGDRDAADDLASPDHDPGMYEGTYELEILWPNHVADADGFSVPYCPADDLVTRDGGNDGSVQLDGDLVSGDAIVTQRG